MNADWFIPTGRYGTSFEKLILQEYFRASRFSTGISCIEKDRYYMQNITLLIRSHTVVTV